MRLVLIIAVILVGLFIAFWKLFGYFEEKNQKAEINAAQAEVRKEMRQNGYAPTSPGQRPALADADSPAVGAVPLVQSVGTYRFVNRGVPEVPQILRNESSKAMTVSNDQDSNSWVWIGDPVIGSQIKDLASSYDKPTTEMDLDFVLLLMNHEKLSSMGINVFYEEGASWLTSLNLRGDTGSLRITSGGWGMDLELTKDTAGLTLLSQPVIRTVEGNDWSFDTDSEVPIPTSEILDGVIRQNVEFRKIGFGLQGKVKIIGQDIMLRVEQRNGAISPATAQEAEFPIFANQTLKTTVKLAYQEWSVLGGISVDREESRKGLFRDSFKRSSEYLIIFVRPRLALGAVPKALAILPDGHPLMDGEVLPSKDWLDQEIKLVEDKLRSAK